MMNAAYRTRHIVRHEDAREQPARRSEGILKTRRINRLTAAALLVALIEVPSVFAEKRTHRRTDLENLARELEQRLGRNAVRIERTQKADGRKGTPVPAHPRGTSFVESIVDEMNRVRVRHGLDELRLHPELARASSMRVAHMHEHNYFDHVGPDGTQPFSWIARTGYRYTEAGENLAIGHASAADVVNGWMRSPGHRANILGRYSDVGIAVSDSTPVRGYRAPLVVAMYARPSLR